MKNYSKISIYKIYCLDSQNQYVFVGSTTNLKVKRSKHKQALKNKPEAELSKVINKNGGWENWQLEELEKYECSTREDAVNREKYWYDLITSSKFTHFPSKFTQKFPSLPQNLLKIPSEFTHFSPEKQENSAAKNEIQINELQCNYCNKIYSRKDNLKRHLQTCKCKQKYDEKLEIITVNNQLQLHNKSPVMETNELHIASGNQTNSNNSLMNMHNSNNITTIHNNITNNPITIIPLGKENLVDFFSDEEQVKILKKMFGCFIYLVEYVHFSGKFPQFANIRINNLRSDVAYIYNDDDKRFNAYNQTEVIAEVISERLTDITNFFENVKDKLSTKETQRIQQLINEIEEQQVKYKEYQKKVKLMMYNKRHMVNI